LSLQYNQRGLGLKAVKYFTVRKPRIPLDAVWIFSEGLKELQKLFEMDQNHVFPVVQHRYAML
jgi:hypothetical protein